MKKGIIAIVIVALCAMLFYGIRYVNTPVDTIEAKVTTYEEASHGKAYFVRRESIYTAPASGTVYYHVPEGARVANAKTVATIYDGIVSPDILQELNTLDKKIEKKQNENNISELYSSDSSSVESKVENYKNSIVEAAEEKDVVKIADYKNDLNNLRSGNNQAPEDKLKQLESQKAEVEKKIGAKKTDVASTTSGIFTTLLDGLEDQLTPESAKEFTVSQFNALPEAQGTTPSNNISKGDIVGKVVNNHVWYVLTSVDAKMAEKYKKGSKVKMRFANIPGEQASASISYISPEENGQVVMLLECRNYVEGAFSFRSGEMDLIFESYTGFQVPIHAVRTTEDQHGIIGEVGTSQKFYPCEVLYTNTEEGFAIVEAAEGETSQWSSIERIVVGEK